MNNKIEIQLPKPLVGLFPVPVVLVTSVSDKGKQNIMTAGWVGVACSEPPMISLAVRPCRYSYKLIKTSGEFVINIPTVEILDEVDYCGKVSGKHVDKFLKTGLKPLPASKVQASLIEQCPVNLECEVKKCIPLGSHDLFIGRVLVTYIDNNILYNEKNNYNNIDFKKITTIVVNFFEYWSLKEKTGDVFKICAKNKY